MYLDTTTYALVAAAVILASGVGLFWYELTQRRRDAAHAHADRLSAARASHRDSIGSLDEAFNTLRGMPARLDRLATAARDAATASQAGAQLRLNAPRSRGLLADWRVPADLRHDSPRPGDPEPWQALDRSIAHLLATIDYPQADFADHARAYERLADAAAALADEIRKTPRPQNIEQCWFCGQTVDEVARIVQGPHASICNECVEVCNEVLG